MFGTQCVNLKAMKNIIKLFAAGLVILASNSFAQSQAASDKKLVSTSNTTIAGVDNGSNIRELRDQPNVSSRRTEHRRELRAQGLKGKEFRQAYRQRMHAHKVARHEQKLARRANHADQVNANHETRRHNSQLERRDVTRREVEQHNDKVNSRRNTTRR